MKKIVIVSGPTASGKTSFAIDYAEKNNGVIINADSRQIYKGLPVLSAQPNEEEKRNIEHLLYSVIEPTENCSVAMWLELVKQKIEYCFKKEKLPIVVGGTGMYISKLINGISKIPEIPQEIREKTIKLYNNLGYEEFYKKALKIDKECVEKLNPNDKQRLMRIIEVYEVSGSSMTTLRNAKNIEIFPQNYFFHININPPKNILYKTCLLRFERMIKNDRALEEIKNFMGKYSNILKNPLQYPISNTIGFLDGIKYLNKELSLENYIEISTGITRRYAKRQYTWFNHQFKNFDLRI
jgi:tRNA dimethylallyltransferase